MSFPFWIFPVCQRTLPSTTPGEQKLRLKSKLNEEKE
jgi:hypothetical protein